MREDTRLALAVESILYESTVNGLAETHQSGLKLGVSREEMMYSNTRLIMEEMDLPKAASLAAMAIAMIAEERNVPG